MGHVWGVPMRRRKRMPEGRSFLPEIWKVVELGGAVYEEGVG